MLPGFHPTGIPMDPDRTAGPRARPGTLVGGFHFSRVFPKEINVVFDEQQVRLAQPLRFFARPLPKLQKIRERQNVFFPLFAHANIPAIVLANVQP